MAHHVDEVVAIVNKQRQDDLFELVIKQRRVYAMIVCLCVSFQNVKMSQLLPWSVKRFARGIVQHSNIWLSLIYIGKIFGRFLISQ